MASRHPRVFILSIEGAIAVGKTTFIESVVMRITGVTFVLASEPVSEWQSSGLLKAFYESPQRMAGIFQMYAFATRIGKLAECYQHACSIVAKDPAATVVIVTERSIYADRAIFKDMLYDEGLISDVENAAYEGSFKAWEKTINHLKPDLVLLLSVKVDTAMNRIAERARPEERTLTPSYEQRLIDQHAHVFGGDTFEGAPIVTIDGACNFKTDDQAAETLRRLVQTHLLTTIKAKSI